MDDFSGRTVVVTGAASGIGRGLACRFAEAGATIVAADLDRDGLAETVALVHERGGTARACETDVRNPAALEALADFADTHFGGTDVLCNNAGVFRGGMVWANPPDDWEWVFSVNVFGVVNGLRAFVPRMIARGTPGHIVNTASMAGLIASGMSGIYTASKFAVVAISETLAKDLQAVGAPIGVSVVCPSAVATRIGSSQRNRETVAAPAEDADAIEQILDEFCSKGIDPMDAAARVVSAVRAGQFLIGTADTVAEFLQVRNDALMRYELPPFQMFD
jgi:NAD(P)-dependent dehydrogenase (short-subunit alcohol dehydrogenase family)